MATARSKLVDESLPLHYHLVSRCVRRSWLCGRDTYSGKQYDHRKTWLKARLFHLAKYFAVEVHAFTIMSNHFHLVVYYDPLACQQWSDEEVAYRWTEAFARRAVNSEASDLEETKRLQRQQILEQPERLAMLRKTLGSLSAFMKHLKQPIAWRANREDGCTGHFFEGRFYSGALLSEAAVLAAMAYVDLNPVRAKIARSIEHCRDSSIYTRLKALSNTPERLKAALGPLVSGIETPVRLFEITLQEYADRLRILIDVRGTSQLTDAQTRWFARVASIRKRQRAYGFVDELRDWIECRGWKRLGTALPD